MGVGIRYLGRQINFGGGDAVREIDVSANMSVETRSEIDFRAAAIRDRHRGGRECRVSPRRGRGDRIFARRQAVHAIIAVGIRGDRFRFGAGDGDGNARKTIGIGTPEFIGPAALQAAEDGSTGRRFGQAFDPLYVGVVRPADYFVSAAAASGANAAIGRRVSVNQVVVSFREFEATGGALVGSLNDRLFPGAPR